MTNALAYYAGKVAARKSFIKLSSIEKQDKSQTFLNQWNEIAICIGFHL
jgi:hypothetical protein